MHFNRLMCKQDLYKQYPGKNFGEKNARCALIDGDSRDPSNSRQFLADRVIWR